MSSQEAFPNIDSSLYAGLSRLKVSGSDPEVDLSDVDAAAHHAREQLLQMASGDRKRRYVFDAEIARGGMGAIYRVLDTDLRRTLAMKVILDKGAIPSADACSIDPFLLARFVEEAQVTAQLDHPGIVPLHEVGMDAKGRAYFTMRLVRGHHLGDIFEFAREGKEGWTLERAIEALVKVCEAMAYAHTKGVVHRDLKPQNIMAGRFGEVYVMDWGLAKVKGRPEHGQRDDHEISASMVNTGRDVQSGMVTIAGSIFGTPAYMAPEQARGEIELVDSRSDMYSLGAILYHLLAGHAPYVAKGAHVSTITVLQWVIAGPPQPLREIAPEAPRDLVAVCEKAMQRDPAQRYQDMRALADDLRNSLAGRPVSALPLSPWSRAERWCRRNPWAAALLLAVTLGGGFGVWRVAVLGDDLVRDSVVESTADKAQMLEVVNALYSSAVVARVDRAHVEVTHDWAAKAGAIPLPATFLTELASRINDADSGVKVKHYSDYPFRFRGPANLDEFGRNALIALRNDPDKPVQSFESVQGRPMLRYAVARRMSESCITCHNTHPDSTKTDWKVGDVRGVLEVDRMLDQDAARSRKGLKGALTVVALVVMGLTALCAFALVQWTGTKITVQ